MNTNSTIATYALDGNNRKFVVPFEYLARKFVVVTIGEGVDKETLTMGTDYRFINPNSIETTLAYPAAKGIIQIRRYTSATQRLVDFYDGSVLRSRDLNVSTIQTLHVAEEARDTARETLAENDVGNLDARGRRLVNLEAGVDPKDAVTKEQIESWEGSAAADAIRAEQSAQAAAQSARGVLAVDSITDLLALPLGQIRQDLGYMVRGYYADSDLGGGQFYWDESHPKELADGGIAIDPTSLGGFDGSVDSLPAFLKAQGTGTGTGCWVRQLVDGKVRPSYFGYIAGDPETGLASVWASCRYGRKGSGVHLVLDEEDLVTSPTGSLPALGLGALAGGTGGGFIEGLDNLTLEIPSGKTWKLNSSFDFNFRPKGIGRYAGHKNLKIYGGGSFSGDGGTGRPFICFNLAHVTNVTVLNITFDECTNGHTFDVMGCTNLLFRDCKWYGSTLDFNTARYNKEAIQFDVTGDGSRRIGIAEDNDYLDYVGNRHILIQDCQWKPKLNPDGSVSSYSVRPFGNHESGAVDVDRDVVIEGCYIEAAHPAEGLYSKGGHFLEFNVIDGLVIRNNTIVLNHCPYYAVFYLRESASGTLYDKATNSNVSAPMPTGLPCPKLEGNHIECNISGRIAGEVTASKLVYGNGVHILNNTVNTNIPAEEASGRHGETPGFYRMQGSGTHLNYLNEVIIRGNKVHGCIREFGGLTEALPQGRPPLELYEIADNFFELPTTITEIVAETQRINVVNNNIGLGAFRETSILRTLNGKLVRVTGNTIGPKGVGVTQIIYWVREGGVTGSANTIISENVSADSILQNVGLTTMKKYNNYNIGTADMLTDKIA